MNRDQHKKTLRQFQCRDYLWDIFEQMSGELECSVDYLINEAMRQYAKARSYGAPRIPSAPSGATARPDPMGYPSSSGQLRSAAPQAPTLPPPPRFNAGAGLGQQSAPPPYPPPGGPPPAPDPYGHPEPGPGGYNHGGLAPAGRASGATPPLYVVFNGQKFPVAKGEFIIGRGSKTADLPIKDGNISRRHAAVVWQNGAWFVKDLGSTNGVEYQGRKIDSKRIEEGDVFQLCDYEIAFTYR